MIKKNLNKLSVEQRMKMLDVLRRRIDFLDKILVNLLNRRTRFSVKIGRIKKSLDLPTYTPEREREIMKKLHKVNKGPLSHESLERIYERLLDESRSVQKSSNDR